MERRELAYAFHGLIVSPIGRSLPFEAVLRKAGTRLAATFGIVATLCAGRGGDAILKLLVFHKDNKPDRVTSDHGIGISGYMRKGTYDQQGGASVGVGGVGRKRIIDTGVGRG